MVCADVNVIGLDLSLTCTGIAHADQTSVVLTAAKGPERLDHICNAVMDCVAASDPAFVVVEGYSFSSRNSHAHALGELGGVVRYALWKAGVPYAEVPPTCRAKFATGKGNAGKAEVVSAVSARTGLVWSGKGAEDRCDAWVLQEMGLAHLGRARHDWPAANLSALSNVIWPPGEES